MKIGVLGAGLSGLTSALLLQNKGYQVTVFEQEAVARGDAVAQLVIVDGNRGWPGGGWSNKSKHPRRRQSFRGKYKTCPMRRSGQNLPAEV